MYIALGIRQAEAPSEPSSIITCQCFQQPPGTIDCVVKMYRTGDRQPILYQLVELVGILQPHNASLERSGQGLAFPALTQANALDLAPHHHYSTRIHHTSCLCPVAFDQYRRAANESDDFYLSMVWPYANTHLHSCHPLQMENLPNNSLIASQGPSAASCTLLAWPRARLYFPGPPDESLAGV